MTMLPACSRRAVALRRCRAARATALAPFADCRARGRSSGGGGVEEPKVTTRHYYHHGKIAFGGGFNENHATTTSCYRNNPMKGWRAQFATSDDAVATRAAEEINKSAKSDREISGNSNRHKYHEPFTGHQKSLLDYTSSILTPTSEHPIGTLSSSQLIQISNCIHQWISSGEHRYLGAEQAELLLVRLIVERGGGRSLRAEGCNGGDLELKRRLNVIDGQTTESSAAEFHRGNERVTWEMFHFFPVIRYLNALYDGQEFVDRVMGIVATLEDEYARDEEEDDQQRTRQYTSNRSAIDEEIPYKAIISCLCDRLTPHATLAAEHVLHRFEERLAAADSTIRHSNPPTSETYNSVMTAWRGVGQSSYPVGSRPPGRSRDTNPCGNVLSQMLARYESNPRKNERIRPDFVSFNTAISSLAGEQIDLSWKGDRRGDGDSKRERHYRTIGRRCHDHLMSMLHIYRNEDRSCAPDLITFGTVLNALGRGRNKGDVERASEVLKTMLSLGGVLDAEKVMNEEGQEDDDIYQFDVVPLNKHFNIVLALMAHQGHVGNDTLRLAQWFVNIMEQLREKEQREEASNSSDGDRGRSKRKLPQTLQLPEEGWASTHYGMLTEQQDYTMGVGEGGTGGAFDDDSERKRNIHSMTSSAPDIITYNTLLKIAKEAGQPRMAEEILNGMILSNAVRPDNVSFNTVISAWSKWKGPEGRHKIEKILQRMQEMADNGDPNVRPDRASLTTVISALVASAKRNRDAPAQAEQIVERMEKNSDVKLRPDIVTYSTLIKCWIESGRPKAGTRAEEIIKLLHQRYEEGNVLCKPDTRVYNVAMDALAKCDYPDSAERAEALLNRMQDHYYAGDSDLAPNTLSYSTTIQAWARSRHPKGAMKAEKLLQAMHELEESGGGVVSPNTIAYTTCIMAWRNSRRRDAGERADALLSKMERYEEKGKKHLKPNVIAFTNAMEAWINSRHPNSLEKVEGILEHMIARSVKGDKSSAPTTTTFNVVMKAIQHSSHKMKHKKAEELFNRMKQMRHGGNNNVRPDIFTYNQFFSVCAATKGSPQTRLDAFSLVLNALIELQGDKHLNPDVYTWPAVWKTCENQLDLKKDLVWINRVFDLTIKSGKVDELLFNNMRNFLPPQYLQKKLKTTVDVQSLTVHDLPPAWTCNVKLGRERGRGSKKNAIKKGAAA